MLRRLAPMVGAVVMIGGSAFAQDANLFHLRVGSAMTGTEEYQIV